MCVRHEEKEREASKGGALGHAVLEVGGCIVSQQPQLVVNADVEEEHEEPASQ